MWLMSEEWDRLARALFSRRTALGLSRQRVADAAGVSLGSVKNLEQQGNDYKRMPSTLAPITEVLGWTRESARNVMAGGDPTLEAGAVRVETPARYEVEEPPADAGEVGIIVRNTVIEVIGAIAPNTPLSEVQEIEARALEAVLRRGARPRQRHHEAYQDAGATDATGE